MTGFRAVERQLILYVWSVEVLSSRRERVDPRVVKTNLDLAKIQADLFVLGLKSFLSLDTGAPLLLVCRLVEDVDVIELVVDYRFVFLAAPCFIHD